VNAVLVAVDGKIVGTAAREYRREYPAPNKYKVAAELDRQSSIWVVNNLLRKSGMTSSAVVGLAISSQGETLIQNQANRIARGENMNGCF
jgi:glycerol kinase